MMCRSWFEPVIVGAGLLAATLGLGSCSLVYSLDDYAGGEPADASGSRVCGPNTDTDPFNCGACGIVCIAPGPAYGAGCVAGECRYACNAGRADCDGNPVNGCETDVALPVHCGKCDGACGDANGTPICETGVCKIQCNPDYADCDGQNANGCESNLKKNPSHCGDCGHACNTTGGTASCDNGVCKIVCDPGFADCDSDATNGCEINIWTDKNNCSKCGQACPSGTGGQVCSGGVCGMACSTGLADCDGNTGNGCETNTATDTHNCGGCNITCSNVNGTASCAGGQCSIACDSGFADCDGKNANGCEVDLRTSSDNCGACGTVCSSSHGTPSCSNRTCQIVCSNGWGDCNGDITNGCERYVLDDVNHCGSCTKVCSINNNAPTCSGGACQLHCSSGYVDCDVNADTGCEINTNTDANHCGSCAKVCSTINNSPTCVSGVCQVNCTTGYSDCNANPDDGCETNTANDVNHCGNCTTACNSPPTASCPSPDVSRYSDPSGACSTGSCNYPSHDVTCNSPPGATCIDASNLKSYVDSLHDCSGGSCNYSSTNAFCAKGCSNNACNCPYDCLLSASGCSYITGTNKPEYTCAASTTSCCSFNASQWDYVCTGTSACDYSPTGIFAILCAGTVDCGLHCGGGLCSGTNIGSGTLVVECVGGGCSIKCPGPGPCKVICAGGGCTITDCPVAPTKCGSYSWACNTAC